MADQLNLSHRDRRAENSFLCLLPRIMFLISRSIDLKTDVAGMKIWLCRVWFRCLHIWYIVAWAAISLIRVGALFEPCLIHERSSVQFRKPVCEEENLDSTNLQISALKPQWSRIWSLDSCPNKQRGQAVGIAMFQEASLRRVGRRFNCAVHIWKACLGTQPLNQTNFDHSFLDSVGLHSFQVFAAEKTVSLSPFVNQ